MKVALSQRVTQATNYKEIRDALSHDWIIYLENFCVTPFPVPNQLKRIDTFLEHIRPDLLILTGGNTVGTKDCIDMTDVNLCRDDTERQMIYYAIENGIPILGICRGMQMLNVYFGGTLSYLSQNNINHSNRRHNVRLNANQKLKWGNERIVEVNSYHHQGIIPSDLSSSFQPLAYCEADGSIEAFIHMEFPIIGLMWHPEREKVVFNLDKLIVEYLLMKGGVR